MAYQVLARKYRPQRFADVIGQEHVTRTLANALEQSRVAHGYIFSGHRGIGKTTIARILAMALNCRRAIGSAERPTFEPCLHCESCDEIRAGNAVDVIEIDAATNRGIDEIRELRDAARYRPARDRYKIYILDEAHQITDAAFNALLKTLEEPPDHVVFMMATTEPENILQTIRSRCQHFSFHAVKFDAILAQLGAIASAEAVVAEDEALGLLAEAGDGSMRDALSIMDQAIASAPLAEGRPVLEAEQVRALMGTLPNAVFARLLESIAEANSAAVLAELDRLLGAGNSAAQIARQMVRYLRNVLMARIGGAETELLQISPDERARAGATAMLFSEEELLRFLQVMLRTFDELNYRQEQRFHLEIGVLKLVHLQRLLPLEELIGQMGGGGIAARGSATSATVPVARTIGSGTASSSPASAPRAAVSVPQSPFEQDAQRKSATAAPMTPPPNVPSVPRAGSSGKSSGAAGSEDWLSALPAAVPPARQTAPGPEIAKESVETAGPLASEVVPGIVPEIAPQVQAPAAPEPQAAKPDGLDLAGVRDAACAALEAAGHATAAALVAAGKWSETATGLRVEVAVKKVMLGLTMNAEADKIARAAIRPLAGSRPIEWVPGEGGGTSEHRAPSRPAVSGSVQAAALEHPLVQQAQKLFGAEVRSVVDLRPKR